MAMKMIEQNKKRLKKRINEIIDDYLFDKDESYCRVQLWFEKSNGIHSDVGGLADPQACAILAAGLLIADEIGKFASYLTDDKALGALDLHTRKIAEAIESAGTAISESLEENR